MKEDTFGIAVSPALWLGAVFSVLVYALIAFAVRGGA
jgi:hypothetical protein